MGRRTSVRCGAGALVSLLLGAFAGGAVTAAAQTPGTTLQAGFAAAAREFGVPENVLLAVSYNETRWESHQGHPSTSGAWGVMGLTEVPFDAVSRRGADAPNPLTPSPTDPALHTVGAASQLLGVPTGALRTDPVQNVRGGAALLAQYERRALGSLPADAGRWYPAVARYSGAADVVTAQAFADDVFTTLAQGASRTTSDGQQVTEPAQAVIPDRAAIAALGLKDPTSQPCPDVPSSIGVKCEYVPAAYQRDDPNDDTNYGNYDIADRTPAGDNGMPKVQYFVMHDNEGSFDGTLNIFQDPLAYVSAHFEVRSSDGLIAQMVPVKDVAWHAGNWYVNMHAIGIEQEGFAITGASWYTEQLYHASARLVRYLADRYQVPLDRMHILGHDNVPGNTAGAQRYMHWDPGPFWNWDHFMDLVGAGVPRLPNVPGTTRVVAITPHFATNQPGVYCDPRDEPTTCPDPSTSLVQPSSFVYVHTAPSATAPLLTNPNIPSSWNPLWAHDWANKASSDQLFVAAGRRGDWQGIYFSGQVGWFYDPASAPTAAGSPGHLIATPRAGLASIPVYGRAYPEASAYPANRPDIAVAPIVSFDTIGAGQSYVAWGPVPTDYYWANRYATQLQGSDHLDVMGTTKYYEISFNHRVAYVNANDVTLSRG